MLTARLLQYLTCLSVVLLMAGCNGQSLRSYHAGDELLPGNGWLVLSVNSSTPEVAFEIQPSGLTNQSYRSVVFGSGRDFKLMQLPIGDYEITGVFDKALLWTFVQPEASADFAFTVYPQSATLLGDLTLDGDSLSLQRFSAEHSQADDFLAEAFIPLEGLYLITNDSEVPGEYWDIVWTRAD